MSNTIDSNLFLKNYQQPARKTGTDVLGKDDFLKILMTQLQNQDPMNPLEDKDFIAQMAQFSTLEQMTNMSQNFEKMANQQSQSALIQYQQFVGKAVTWHKVIEEEDGTVNVQEGKGTVTSIHYKGDNVSFKLMDGTELEPANISNVYDSFSDQYMIQASGLINKKVTWIDHEGIEQTAVVSSVLFKDGAATFKLKDEKQSTITLQQITKISE
ncbi:flagellar hook assembly protein FlgD [Metabacillus iocasae]|uniref:Basal-body rod modification protein FlgD n=1 Tax=Priestia iocasae TaxID=2291674 RepID=A0ABS2QR43_9BACI|nr:flagellar hook assembly protein FlgD [Metabacillus iocasae]MBM7701870.1 flagellar basal-body rod modification protein FlgD [Metabacillus iocasae]